MHDGDPSKFTKVLYGCGYDEISETVLMTPIRAWFDLWRERWEVKKEFKGYNQGFCAIINGVEVSVLDSRVGSPLALDCTYYLRFTPCKNIVFTGLIGAIQPDIEVGDIIAPTGALRGEGASRYFVDEAYPAVADFGLTCELADVLDEVYEGTGINVHYGSIYTTDAFAAETEDFLKEWGSKGLLGIEMETSVVYVIASLYGMRATSFHVVSDNPLVKKTFFDALTGVERKRQAESSKLVVEVLERLVKEI